MLNVNPVESDNEAGAERFEAVALLHMQELYRTAAAMLRDRIQAQDIVQETYTVDVLTGMNLDGWGGDSLDRRTLRNKRSLLRLI